MTELVTVYPKNTEYKQLLSERINNALRLPRFEILNTAQFQYGFNDNFMQMADSVNKSIVPGNNNVVILDLDGVFYTDYGYFNALSDEQITWLESLKENAEVYIVSSRTKVFSITDPINPMMKDLKRILGSDRVIINTDRQKKRKFDEGFQAKNEDDNFEQLVDQFAILKNKFRDPKVNITHVADTGHALSLHGSDLAMWRGNFEGKTELMAMENFIRAFQSVGITVERSELQFLDHGKFLTKVGKFIMKHVAKMLQD